MRLHNLQAYTLITIVQTKRKKILIRCIAPTCAVNNLSLANRKDSSAKKVSLLNGNFLDFSGVELGEKIIIRSGMINQRLTERIPPERIYFLPTFNLITVV